MKYILAAFMTMLPLNLMGFCVLTKKEDYQESLRTIYAAGFTQKDIKPIHDEGKLIYLIIYYD